MYDYFSIRKDNKTVVRNEIHDQSKSGGDLAKTRLI